MEVEVEVEVVVVVDVLVLVVVIVAVDVVVVVLVLVDVDVAVVGTHLSHVAGHFFHHTSVPSAHSTPLVMPKHTFGSYRPLHSNVVPFVDVEVVVDVLVEVVVAVAVEVEDDVVVEVEVEVVGASVAMQLPHSTGQSVKNTALEAATVQKVSSVPHSAGSG